MLWALIFKMEWPLNKKEKPQIHVDFHPLVHSVYPLLAHCDRRADSLSIYLAVTSSISSPGFCSRVELRSGEKYLYAAVQDLGSEVRETLDASIKMLETRGKTLDASIKTLDAKAKNQALDSDPASSLT
jgi:hypothetical protein